MKKVLLKAFDRFQQKTGYSVRTVTSHSEEVEDELNIHINIRYDYKIVSPSRPQESDPEK
jgi:hypothetical protein